MRRDDLVYAAQAVAESRRRRANDPLASFQAFTAPGGGQLGFLESAADEAWYSGANRIGKSDALAVWIAAFARFGNPNPRASYCSNGIVIYDRAVSIWVVSPTFPMSRDIMQAKIFDNGYVPPGAHRPFIPPHEIIQPNGWHAGNNILRLRNGSIIGFKSADQGQESFYGTGKDAVCFDEPPPENIYNECAIRIEAGRKLWIRGAATLLPEEGQTVDNIDWLFERKFDPWMRGENRDKLEVYTASIYDNPHLGRDEVTRLESIYPEGSIERRIRLNGELVRVAGGTRAYPPFQRNVHVNPALDRHIHLDWRLPLLLCVDWNVEPMGATVWQYQMERGIGMYRGMAEITIETDASPTELAQVFRRLFPAHGAEVWMYGDATGKNRGQTGRSNYTLFADAMRGSNLSVRYLIPEANPNIQDRLNSVNHVLRDSQGRVRLEVPKSFTETIADFEKVVRTKDGKIFKTTNKKSPMFRRTSWTDGIGYMLAYREPALRLGGPIHRERRIRMKQVSYGGVNA